MNGPANRLVLATSNSGKVTEIRELLAGRFDVEPRPGELPETVEEGDTLEANARKKAAHVTGHTGAVSLADDTGLFVDAIDGAPGIHTARYAGAECDADHNMAKLLAALDGLPHGERTAEFRTVIALIRPDGSEVVAEGRVSGTIADKQRGVQGFGYDPLFLPDEGDGRTFAEMNSTEKHRYSHRARALDALLRRLDGE